ncbi:hypothetical protein Y1Q_0003220 [Alligator mississippiensis]|uniref:Uncharacterized protein n=1 Tax=Alligator mississippiensis TaxID=8496 RepID=A0A151MDX4_ALLMI|nr:hypothetical protein Y1Q_0003220 [Alligator mississippiensis]
MRDGESTDCDTRSPKGIDYILHQLEEGGVAEDPGIMVTTCPAGKDVGEMTMVFKNALQHNEEESSSSLLCQKLRKLWVDKIGEVIHIVCDPMPLVDHHPGHGLAQARLVGDGMEAVGDGKLSDGDDDSLLQSHILLYTDVLPLDMGPS